MGLIADMRNHECSVSVCSYGALHSLVVTRGCNSQDTLYQVVVLGPLKVFTNRYLYRNHKATLFPKVPPSLTWRYEVDRPVERETSCMAQTTGFM